MPKISPFLWFDTQAEEAATFYVSIFPRSRIVKIARYGDAGPGPAGSVMTVQFELDGQEIIALNGGPHFRFTEAISLSIDCKSQEEVDHFWSKLTAGGEESQCGWLKDRFGLSWQVTPSILTALTSDPDPVRAGKAMAAMMTMRKIDIAALLEAVGDRPKR
jgi:predicted 3-demethylubiquinone-9 3-methyltransferase (glyoxalase superfamily)